MDQQKQVDLIVDFSNVFNTVPHQRLPPYTKSAHYGIQGDACRWICSWLTLHIQCVGEASHFVRVYNVWSSTRNCVRPTNVFPVLMKLVKFLD